MAEAETASMASQLSSQTLDAVAREINVSLAEARIALEAFVEASDNAQLLQRCRNELAQVQGVLRALEIHGAALLAEEMHQVCIYLEATLVSRKNQNEALDALMRAIVQLPTYLDRVLAGGRDMALVLLPLLNDMRAVRGSPLLSEGTLLSLNLKSDRQAAPQAPVQGEENLSVASWARKLRTQFQSGMVGWIRGERVDQHLDTLASVASRFEKIATTQALFQLWWVAGAVIEALRERGLDSGVSVKRLLGLADREIKRLYEQGEARYASHPPVELLNNLLYYVARSGNAGPRVAAVRESFRLGELLPVDESVEQERENLSAPSIKLMQTVGAAIREDLAKVKDVLDIFVRRGGAAPEELGPQVELLRKIGDTLGVLGLGEQRARVQAEITKLEALVATQEKPSESALIDIAATLIQIEDRLDDDLVGKILPRSQALDGTGSFIDADFQQVQAAVLRECVVNLARVKEYVTQQVGGNLDTAGFDAWQDLMRGIQSGLAMLGKARAESVVTRISAHLKRIMQSGGGPAAMAGLGLDRLADAIVSVEYYMETLQAGRTDPWYMLDNAERALAAVDTQPATIEDTAAVKINTGTDVLDRRTLAPLAPTPGAFIASSDDPELITVFLEEAREEAEKIRNSLPAWDQDPSLDEALSTARRAFHTLKGSGRVVGATALAEFAWSIENLMNRLLDRTQTRSPAILAVLREAVEAVPQLIDQLESARAPAADIAGIAARANALAAGKPLEGSAAAAAAPVSQTTQFAVPSLALPMPEPEPSLSDIYARETDSHVSTVRAWLAKLQEQPGPHLLPESVYRASHTLSGSSKTAGARHGVRLAEPLNHWLRKSFDNAMGVSTEDLVLIADCMTAMESVSRNLRENTGFFATHDTLLERIAQAEAQLDQRIAAYSNASSSSTPAEPLAPVEVVPVAPPVAESAAAPDPQPSAEEPESLVVDYDPEVAAIFSEEATELLESCQSSFQGIGLTAPRREEFAALKRPLHTLKGGARMAGVKSMGDLGHELESLIIGIELGNVPPSQVARETLQRSLDELGRMRDLLAGNQPVPAASRLLAQVRALTGNLVVSTGTHPALPVLEAAPHDTMPGVAAMAAPEPEQPSAPMPAGESRLEPVTDFLSASAIYTQLEPEPEPVPPVPAVEEFAPAPLVPPAPSNVIELPRSEPIRQPPQSEAPPATPAFPPPAPVRPQAFAKLMAAAAVPPGREPAPPPQPAEMARVDAELLNQLLNQAGEVSIARARVEQQLASTEFNLAELSRTVTRLREQLNKLEMETEAQILHRHETETGNTRTDFDPLELDRYSSIQQFSRALAETANDVASIQALLENLTRDTQTQLQLQGRTIVEMQNGLMRTRMVSFQRHVQRLSRIVRQTAADEEKKAELIVEGASGELDRQVLERMLPPFEHLLRNAVVHGIEKPEVRHAAGKSDTGQIRLQLRREGAEVIVDVRDDGAGMNIERIRTKALSLGLITEGQALSDEEAMQLILEPGFSTAENLTQAAGRGVGMDVVANEVKKLGGSLLMETAAGKGSRFMIRLPLSLSVGHAVILRIGDEQYALPMPTIEGVVRIPREELQQHLLQPEPSYLYGGYKYRLQHLANFVGLEAGPLPEEEPTLPVVLVRAGELSTGVVAEEMLGTREIVVKPVGPQIAGIRGVSGATILGDGRIVVILDMGQLVRTGWRGRKETSAAREALDRRIVALVVDDSITVRRVTQRLLERNGMRVLTARDGQDALAVMEENVPDVVLLDIEMPRMDGYQVAEHMRADARLKHVPIIMITSRVGEKHRARAMEIGVDEYLGKPYQESQLLEAIVPLVDRTRASRVAGG